MKKILLVLATVMCFWEIKAQTIHAVCFADTLDDGIGKSCAKDVSTFKNNVYSLHQFLGYDINPIKVFAGKECKGGILRNVLNGLQTSPDDIIMFHYAGHGGRAETSPDKFPQMDMYNEPPENYVYVSEVRRILASKPSRLRIIVADCCNKQASWYRSPVYGFERGATIVKDQNKANLKKLFLDFKGEIVISGCKAGQTSAGDNEKGGFCTYSYFAVLNAVGSGALKPDWNTVCNETQKSVSAMNPGQIPEYEINGSIGTPSAPPNPNPSVYPQSPLAEALAMLINKNNSLDSRLSMVSTILSNYFTPDAMVIEIGADLQTHIEEYENAESFLKGICFAPNLVQINIIDEKLGYGNKRCFVKIHQIRRYKN